MQEKSLAVFLNELGARTPTPGGGAVAALNGAIAASQLKMICEYTKDEAINSKASFLNQKMQRFLQLAEADSNAFSAVSEAYKNKDRDRIISSLLDALKPSTNIISDCEEIILFCETDYMKFNAKLKADLIVALANLQASVKSALAMISTNIDALEKQDSEHRSDNMFAAQELLARIDSLLRKLAL